MTIKAGVLISILLAAPLLPAASAAAVDLPTAWAAAQASDPKLASAAANRDAAAENIAIANARLMPQLTLQHTSQALTQHSRSALGPSDFEGNTNSTQMSMRQAVYRPREWAGVGIAKVQAEIGELGLATAQSELWTRTSMAWLDVLSAQALRELYARSLDFATVVAEQEERRWNAGEGTRDAAMEASAQRSAARARLREAHLDLHAKLKTFNQLTRLEVGSLEGAQLPEAQSLNLLPEAEPDLLERILASNPELAAARATQALAERRIKQASADHLPTVDLIGAVNRAENDTPNTLGTKYRNWALGVQVVIPLFAGGGVNAAQRQAAAAYTAAAADRDALELRLRMQFSSDWSAQLGLRERARGLQELVLAGREQRKAIDMALKKGLKTLADLSLVDQTLVRRETDVIDAITQLGKAQARILSLLPTSEDLWLRWGAGMGQSR